MERGNKGPPATRRAHAACPPPPGRQYAAGRGVAGAPLWTLRSPGPRQQGCLPPRPRRRMLVFVAACVHSCHMDVQLTAQQLTTEGKRYCSDPMMLRAPASVAPLPPPRRGHEDEHPTARARWTLAVAVPRAAVRAAPPVVAATATAGRARARWAPQVAGPRAVRAAVASSLSEACCSRLPLAASLARQQDLQGETRGDSVPRWQGPEKRERGSRKGVCVGTKRLIRPPTPPDTPKRKHQHHGVTGMQYANTSRGGVR